jgi:hypothetical protein
MNHFIYNVEDGKRRLVYIQHHKEKRKQGKM